jgi:transcriptional regulator of acetoin/glycerol metabolism
MIPALHRRFTALANEYDAVSVTLLPAGGAAMVARKTGGAIAHAELVGRDGETLRRDVALRELAAARANAARLAEQALDAAAALVALAGAEVNVSEVARDLDVSRTTLYARVRALDVHRAE